MGPRPWARLGARLGARFGGGGNCGARPGQSWSQVGARLGSVGVRSTEAYSLPNHGVSDPGAP